MIHQEEFIEQVKVKTKASDVQNLHEEDEFFKRAIANLQEVRDTVVIKFCHKNVTVLVTINNE